MINLSRRKRLLNRTPRPPKMSSRRQFHRALRRHPAWPLVMAEAAARAQAHKEQEAARAQAQKAVRRDRTNVITRGMARGGTQIRRTVRRNRAVVIALSAIGALVALLTGLAVAEGVWTLETHHQTGTGPAGRFGMASTRDGTRNEILLFGGFANTGTPPTTSALNDTWGYIETNRSWTNRAPVHSPSPRGYASMAYHVPSKQTVLFGGAPYRSNAVSGETWTWDGADWTLRNPPGPRPPARQNASMVYDAHRKVVVLFGGRTTSNVAANVLPPNNDILNDTWTWDGSAWKQLKPPLSPTARHSAAMAYDLCRGEAVMFGGSGVTAQPSVGGFQSVAGETWTWNGATWTPKIGLVPSPPARIGAGMVYARRTGRLLLYGGLTTTDDGRSLAATDHDIWGWDGAGWHRDNSDLTTAAWAVGLPVISQGFYLLATRVDVPPPPRAYASFEPLDNPGRISLFGGTPGANVKLEGGFLSSLPQPPQVALFDHWSFGDNFLDEAGAGETDVPVVIPDRKCASPVPIPSDGVPVDGQTVEGPQLRKLETRQEIKEIGQLPVLAGTDPETDPKGCPNRQFQVPHLETDPKRNRLYQFLNCGRYSTNGVASGPTRMLIQAYDAKTLRPLRSAIALMPFTSGPAYDLPSFEQNPPVHDADGGRFLIRHNQDVWVIRQDLIEEGTNPVVGKVTSPGPGVPKTMSYFNHPKTGRGKLLFYLADTVVAGVILNQTAIPTIVQVDVDANREDWRHTVEACSGSSFTGSMAVRIGDRVYTSCTTGSQFGVVRIPVVEDLTVVAGEKAGTSEVFPGPFDVITVWGDPQAERILLLSQNLANQSLWVFDGKSSRYVGRSTLTAGALGSWGFDQETGRFYTQVHDHRAGGSGGGAASQPMIQGGLLTVDTRLTPVPPPEKFGQFSFPSRARMGVLPPEGGLPTRAFVRRNGGSGYSRYPDGEPVTYPNEAYYRVLADLLPVPKQPEIGQLDALTVPIAESAGKTDVVFDAEGSSYGIRLRALGGISAVLNYNDDSLNVGGAKLAPVCFYPDRELMAGWVSQVHLSDLEASARSLGLEVDAASKADLEAPFSRCQPAVGPYNFPPSVKPVADALWPLLPFVQLDNAVGSGILSLEKDPDADDLQHNTGTGLAWDKHFQDVECGGDSTASHKAALGDVYGLATCEQKKARVEGAARGALGSSESEAFSVGEGYSNVVVTRESARGIVVTSTAWATGIKLPGISIGLVKTEAVAWSNGRPSANPRATFKRTICGVNDKPRCLTDQEQKDMLHGRALPNNGKITLPTPDPDFLKGSPGGYVAGVVRPLTEESEEQIFTREVQKELPGLVITFYKDNPTKGYGRQVLQLAAVRAVTGFGVQCGSDFIYSPSAKDCVALSFEDAFLSEPEEEFGNEGELSSSNETEFDSESGWMPLEATGAPEGLALGRQLGRFIENLPIVRQLPIRQMGEALLAGSVWMLLGMPLFLASRRFALNLARRS